MNLRMQKASHSPAMLMLSKDPNYNHHIKDLRMYYHPNNSIMVDYELEEGAEIYCCTVRQAIAIIETYANWWQGVKNGGCN